jgi:uncharacterized protein (DUF1330 family)
MSVYYINSYDIVNPDEFKTYGPLVYQLIQKYGGEVLASDLQGQAVEGQPRMMNAIVKFPSEDAAMGCYNDPEYQEVKKIRLRCASNITMVLVKGRD